VRTRVLPRNPSDRYCQAGSRTPEGHGAAFGVAGCRRCAAPPPRLPRETRPACWRTGRRITPPERGDGRTGLHNRTSRRRWTERPTNAWIASPEEDVSTPGRPKGLVARWRCERRIVARGVAALENDSRRLELSAGSRGSRWSHPSHDRRKSLILARGSSGASSRAPDPPRRPRKGHGTHPGATTGVIPFPSGRTGVAPSNNDPARRLPRKARNDVVHHNRWDSRARRGRSGVASSPLQKSPPHLPERRPGVPSSATTGVILAYCTAILEVALRTSSPACAFPKERQPESESSPGCCPEGLRHVGFEHCGSASAGIRNGSPKLPPSTNLCAPPEGGPPRRIVTTSVIPAVGLAVPELPPGRWTVATQSRGTCHRSPSAGVTEYFTDRGPATSW
jgi:hypothetical protein